MTTSPATSPPSPTSGADSAPSVLPATVVGGWLGAGKTTLVNHLLRHAGGRRIAVLVNDFGEVSIDADLIEGADGGVLNLAGGCMCCSWGEDLFGTLERVRARRPAPDVLLVETSGVAQPAAVARLLRLAPGVDVEGVIVLVDAETVRERAADRYVGDLVRSQITQADLLVLNKQDLVTSCEAAAVVQWLGAQTPGVRVAAALRGRVEPEVVLGWPRGPAGADVPAHTLSAQRDGRRRAGAAGLLGAGGTSGAATSWRRPELSADERFESGMRQFDGPVDVAALAEELTAPGSRVIRAKGVLTALDGRPALLQVVGRRAEIREFAGRPPAPDGRLVWIALRPPRPEEGAPA